MTTMALGDLSMKACLIMVKGATENPDFDPPVVLDTGAVPDDIDSYRGYYDELALGYSSEGFMSLSNFVEMLENADGGTFSGYKGGEFTMYGDTPVWVSNYGNSEGIMVTDIQLVAGKVVLQTQHVDG